MTLIDLVHENEWEKSKKYQKHLQGLNIEQKCQLQFVTDGILGNLLMTLIDLVS